MPKTLEDWKDAYYEQQALHTEARGMLCAERDAWKAKAEEALSALSKTHRWIPVAERLPTPLVAVLVYTQSKINGGHVNLDVTNTEGEFWFGTVTHWMPLPEAPK